MVSGVALSGGRRLKESSIYFKVRGISQIKFKKKIDFQFLFF